MQQREGRPKSVFYQARFPRGQLAINLAVDLWEAGVEHAYL